MRPTRGTLYLIVISGALAASSACGSMAKANLAPNAATGLDGGTGADGGASGGDAGAQCQVDADCGLGKMCQYGQCVDLPPEQEGNAAGVPPVASPRYLWAVAGDGEVARIDVATRAVDVAQVPGGTSALAGLPDVDAALALSSRTRTLTVVEDVAAPRTVALSAAYGDLALSPDGKWAVAWSRELSGTPTGISTVAVVDVAKLRAGEPAVFERAGGYRATDVFFRVQAGAATAVAVVAKDAVNLLDLAGLASEALPRHVSLPAEAGADLASREAVATPDGRFVFVRVFGSTTLYALDADDATATQTAALPLPGAPTDLDLSADGALGVAVLRAEGEVVLVHLPADLGDPGGMTVLSTGQLRVGQAALSTGAPSRGLGPYALLFTTAEPIEQVTRLDLASGALTTFPLEKSVAAIAPSPDGATAVILHRPADAGETDPYERAVDAQQGYALLDVQSGLSSLYLTGDVVPGPVVFAPAGGFAAVLLDPPNGAASGVAAIDLATLIAQPVALDSPALFMGPLPRVPGDPSSGRGVFVSQDHAAGRISFVALDSLAVQTVTGFELNAQIGLRSGAASQGVNP